MSFEDWDTKRTRCSANKHVKQCGMLLTLCEIEEIQAKKVAELKEFINMSVLLPRLPFDSLQQYLKDNLDMFLEEIKIQTTQKAGQEDDDDIDTKAQVNDKKEVLKAKSTSSPDTKHNRCDDCDPENECDWCFTHDGECGSEKEEKEHVQQT